MPSGTGKAVSARSSRISGIVAPAKSPVTVTTMVVTQYDHATVLLNQWMHNVLATKVMVAAESTPINRVFNRLTKHLSATCPTKNPPMVNVTSVVVPNICAILPHTTATVSFWKKGQTKC